MRLTAWRKITPLISAHSLTVIEHFVLLVFRGKHLLCYGLSMEAELGNFGLFFDFYCPAL